MAEQGNLAGPFGFTALGSAFQLILLKRFNRTKRRSHTKETWLRPMVTLKISGFICTVPHTAKVTASSCFSLEYRNLKASKRGILKALVRLGRREEITIYCSQTNHAVIMQCDTECRLRQCARPITVHKHHLAGSLSC